jgi:AAA+ ATPase superfamily predicted ATPase
MRITEHEKQLIKIIDEQVKILQEKNASDNTILCTLVDFFPEVRCLLEGTEPRELELFLSANSGFSYLVNLISLESDNSI